MCIDLQYLGNCDVKLAIRIAKNIIRGSQQHKKGNIPHLLIAISDIIFRKYLYNSGLYNSVENKDY